MKLVQLLSLEISWGCNLADMHSPICPVNELRQTMDKRVNDFKLVDIARKAYEDYSFEGLIAWHFYNEPLLEWDRIKRLMSLISSITSNKARYCLWTNGVLLKKDMIPDLSKFSQIKVSNYLNKDFSWLKETGCDIDVFKPELDGRAIRTNIDRGDKGCMRIFNELIVDYFGYVHPCCQDWKNEIHIGNIQCDSFSTIIDRWRQLRTEIAGRMTKYAPQFCRKCGYRNAMGMFDKPTCERIIGELCALQYGQ